MKRCGQIPWNAIAICVMTKTSWQTGNLKTNEDLGIFLGHALFAGGVREEDILIVEIEELEKLDASKTYPRRLNSKEVMTTPKRQRIDISCGRWFSKIIRKRLRIQRTHSETGIHRKERERISVETLMAIGKSFDLKKQKMTKESIRISGLTQKLGRISFIVIILNREVPLHAPRKSSFFIYKIYNTERNSSEKNIRCGRRNGEKPKHLRRKQIQLY